MDPNSLSTAFGMWAVVVALIGGAITWELGRLRTELRGMNKQLNEYIINMERRVTAIETHLQTHGFKAPKRTYSDDEVAW